MSPSRANKATLRPTASSAITGGETRTVSLYRSTTTARRRVPAAPAASPPTVAGRRPSWRRLARSPRPAPDRTVGPEDVCVVVGEDAGDLPHGRDDATLPREQGGLLAALGHDPKLPVLGHQDLSSPPPGPPRSQHVLGSDRSLRTREASDSSPRGALSV